MEGCEKQFGCLRCSELGQGRGPGYMSAEGQPWQHGEGVCPAQGPCEESPSHLLRRGRTRKDDWEERWCGR